MIGVTTGLDWGAALDEGLATGGYDRRRPAGGLARAGIPRPIVDRSRAILRALVPSPCDGAMIAVTSLSRGDGRSTLAAGLALAVADLTEQRVLLLELDVAYPSQARRFGVRSSPGLSEFLSGGVGLRLWADPDARLWLLPAGRPCPAGISHPPRGDGSGWAFDLRTAGRDRFRWIVLDLPPLLEGPAVARWAAVADHAVIAVRYRRTSVAALERAAATLVGATPAFVMTADIGLPSWFRRFL